MLVATLWPRRARPQQELMVSVAGWRAWEVPGLDLDSLAGSVSHPAHFLSLGFLFHELTFFIQGSAC